MADSTFLHHIPCPDCGSSDAGSLYEDGTAICYVCFSRWTSDSTPSMIAPPPLSGSVAYVAFPARKILQRTCEFWKYGWDHKLGHVAQYFDQGGTLVASKIRGKDKAFSWTGDPTAVFLYGEWLWREGGKSLVITEGEVDALSVSQIQEYRWPVVSVPNGAGGAVKAIKKSLSWVESFERVVFMFDMDEPGQKAAVDCARLLTPGKACIAHLKEKDPNELLKKDRGDLITKAFWDAKVWKPEGILSGKDLWNAMKVRKHAPLAQYPFPELQSMTMGIGKAEIILLCAGIAAGKSTLVRTFADSLLQQGHKLGVLPLEEMAGEFAISLMGMRVGKNYALTPDLDVTTDSDAEEAFKEVEDQLVIYEDDGRRDADAVFDRLRYLTVGLELPVVILDHLTVVIGAAQEKDDRRYAEKVMTDLEALVKRTGVSAIVVMHLRKTGEGRSHEQGRAITMSDIRGSGLIAALSHKIIAYERDQQTEPGELSVGRFRVLKNRPIGRTGSADFVKFDETSGRLLPHTPEVEAF